MNKEQRARKSGMVNEPLLKKIQALSFAKTETELYLDAHPDCMAALEYYRELIRELQGLMDEYEGTVGALRAENETSDGWSWTCKPWPWQIGAED